MAEEAPTCAVEGSVPADIQNEIETAWDVKASCDPQLVELKLLLAGGHIEPVNSFDSTQATARELEDRIANLSFRLKKEEFRLSWLIDNYGDYAAKAEGADQLASEPAVEEQDAAEDVPAQAEQPAPTKKLSKNEEKRMMIVREILETEENYCEALDTMVKVYVKPMGARANTPHPIIPDTHISTIFYQIDDILALHLDLQETIRKRMAEWGPEQLIADIFLTLDHLFSAYLAFVNNYSKALQTARLCRATYPEFVNHVDDVALKLKANRRRYHLNDLLIMPIQRIPRYALLLETLNKNTAEGHPDKGNLVKAVEAVKGITLLINEGQRLAESIEEVYTLQTRLVGECEPLEAPHRRFVAETRVVEVTEQRDRRWVSLITLSDMLLCVKPVKKSAKRELKYLWSVPLADVTVTEDDTPVQIDQKEILNLNKEIKNMQAQLDPEPDQAKPQLFKKMAGSSILSSKVERLEKLKNELAKAKDNLQMAQSTAMFRVDVGGRKGRQYVFIMTSQEERAAWVGRIAALQEDLPGTMSYSSFSETTRDTVGSLPSSPAGSPSTFRSKALTKKASKTLGYTGRLAIAIYSGVFEEADGSAVLSISNPCIVLDVDGGVDGRPLARTRPAQDPRRPVWEEAINVELQDVQTVRFTCTSGVDGPVVAAGTVDMSMVAGKNQLYTARLDMSPRGELSMALYFAQRGQATSRPVYPVFGTRLVAMAAVENRPVPVLLQRLVVEIDTRGLKDAGTYVQPVNASDLRKLKEACAKDPQRTALGKVDVRLLGALVKEWLLDLPDALLPSGTSHCWPEVLAYPSEAEKTARVGALLAQLPAAHMDVLIFFVQHLLRVVGQTGGGDVLRLVQAVGPAMLHGGSGRDKEADLLRDTAAAVASLLLAEPTTFGLA